MQRNVGGIDVERPFLWRNRQSRNERLCQYAVEAMTSARVARASRRESVGLLASSSTRPTAVCVRGSASVEMDRATLEIRFDLCTGAPFGGCADTHS